MLRKFLLAALLALGFAAAAPQSATAAPIGPAVALATEAPSMTQKAYWVIRRRAYYRPRFFVVRPAYRPVYIVRRPRYYW